MLPAGSPSSVNHHPAVIEFDTTFNANGLFVWLVDPVPIANLIKPYPAAYARAAVEFTTGSVVHPNFGAEFMEVADIWLLSGKHLVRCLFFERSG